MQRMIQVLSIYTQQRFKGDKQLYKGLLSALRISSPVNTTRDLEWMSQRNSLSCKLPFQGPLWPS